MRRLIIDTHNILFRVAAMNAKGVFASDEERAALAFQTSLQSVNKYFKKYRPDQLVLSFEGDNNWRKTYTKSPDAVTPWVYKANRVRDPSMEPFFELIKSFHQVMEQHTTAVCIKVDVCEGDDVVADICRRHHDGVENIIVSADKDYIQLLQYPGVTLIDPDSGNARECVDLDYWMFYKCIRGDKGDYVHSAYPRVRETKLREAFTDPYKLQNLMEHEWQGKKEEDGTQKTYRVADVFRENQMLMDLTAQPEWVVAELEAGVDAAFERGKDKRYSNFHLMKFLGAHGLFAIAETIHLYTDMLSAKPKNSVFIVESKKASPEISAINKAEPQSTGRADELLQF